MRQVALIGAGAISERHYDAWIQHNDARIAMVVDNREHIARKRAAEWRVERWSVDYKDALRDPTIDMVDVCLPHYLHFTIVREAILAGKHILVEKPLAITLQECQELMEMDQKSDKVLMVAENWKFSPFVQKAAELIGEGDIGAPFAAQASIRFCPSFDAFEGYRQWHLHKETAGGGVLLNSGVHTISTLEKLMGKIEAISAVAPPNVRKDMDVEDTLWSLVRFANGSVGTIDVSWSTVRAWRNFQVNIFGSNGTIDLDIGAKQFNITTGGGQKMFSLSASEGFSEEIRHFIDCIDEGRSPDSDAATEARAVAIALAAYEAVDSQSWVTVPEL